MPDARMLRAALRTRTGSVLTVAVLFIVCPAFALAGLAKVAPFTLRLSEWLVATAFLVTTVGLTLETYAASRRIPAKFTPVNPPTLSVLIAAYLPNEQEIIIETLRHVLRVLDFASSRTQIVLAYNTPSQLDVEAVLSRLGDTAAHIMPLKVEGSSSKAENIIAALPVLTGEMTVLLDADHHPAADAPARAWRWLLEGYDIVQGRCVVRDPSHSIHSRLIGIEFEQMYAISHQGRSLLADTAIFGGTNGWWRTSVLRKIGMDERMLTEDIDSATRAILEGYRVIHDRSVISTELSTSTFKAWWSQRLRWAQGWQQVAFRRVGRLRATPYLNAVQRTYWSYMLVWGMIFPVFAVGAMAVLLANVLIGHPLLRISDTFLIFSTVMTFAVAGWRTVVTWRVASPGIRAMGRRWMVFYVAVSPIYETLKTTVALIGILREAANINEWVVTSRSRSGGVSAKKPEVASIAS